MNFTRENHDHPFTSAIARDESLAAAKELVRADGFIADGGLIWPDADLDFRGEELGLVDPDDVIDEMRDELPNLKEIQRDGDGLMVTLVAVTGEKLDLSFEVIERRHRCGRTRAAKAGWLVKAFDGDGSPVPIGMAKKGLEPMSTKMVTTADTLRKTVARVFAGWVSDETRRARVRRRGQMKRQTEKNRAKALEWLEDVHGALQAGDRESHRGDLDGFHWLESFDDPELAYSVARYRESGRDVLRVMWLDLTSVDDVAVDLKKCRVEGIDAADVIGEAGVRAILEWDDESCVPEGGTAA